MKSIVENSGNLNGTTQYVYDDWQVVEERDEDDNVIATYIYGNYIDEPITMTTVDGTFYYHDLVRVLFSQGFTLGWYVTPFQGDVDLCFIFVTASSLPPGFAGTCPVEKLSDKIEFH